MSSPTCSPRRRAAPGRAPLSLAQGAGLREITVHELRHTFGTQLAAAGVPLRTIQEWMGHADAKTTKVYRHYAPGPIHGADMGGGGVLATVQFTVQFERN